MNDIKKPNDWFVAQLENPSLLWTILEMWD